MPSDGHSGSEFTVKAGVGQYHNPHGLITGRREVLWNSIKLSSFVSRRANL